MFKQARVINAVLIDLGLGGEGGVRLGDLSRERKGKLTSRILQSFLVLVLCRLKSLFYPLH